MSDRKRLTKKQREAVLTWIAEGLETDEINTRATKWLPPFHVTRPQVANYRKRRGTNLQQIQEADEYNALQTGFALKEARVAALKKLATTLLEELTREEDNRLWTQNAKGIGSGEDFERYDYEEFNKAEIEALRGVFDDIAAEVGHRTKRDANLNVDFSKLTDGQLERLAKGEDLMKVLLNA
jgi:hypothetical protein